MSKLNSGSQTPTEQPVVFVIEALTVGGAEQMLIAMANRFSERGYPVHVICLSQWGELVDSLNPAIERHLLEKKLGMDPSLPGKIRRLIKSIKPAAVNSHLFTANLWTRLSLIGTGTRIVVTEHSRDAWKGFLYRTIDRLFIHTCHKLIAVSNDTAKFYTDDVKVKASKVGVINNGIETSVYSNGNGEALRRQWLENYVAENEQDACVFVGIVGRLVDAKNHARLIAAAAQWKKTAPHIRTLIVGDGPLANDIDQEIQKQHLGQYVFRLGSRRDVPDILSALDIFVLSSDREGHPLTALEAQAAGTPVVLTRAGGCEDAIAKEGDNTGGILVNKDVDEFSQAVATLANDAVKRKQMAVFAQNYALEHFDLDSMVDRYAEVLLA